MTAPADFDKVLDALMADFEKRGPAAIETLRKKNPRLHHEGQDGFCERVQVYLCPVHLGAEAG